MLTSVYMLTHTPWGHQGKAKGNDREEKNNNYPHPFQDEKMLQARAGQQHSFGA